MCAADQDAARQIWMYDLSGAFELTLLAYVVCGIALSVAYYESFFILISLIASLRQSALLPRINKRLLPKASLLVL